MALEIERKFLLATPVDDWEVDFLSRAEAEIAQGYVSTLGDEVEVRVRRRAVVSTGFSADRSDDNEEFDAVEQWLAIKTDIAMLQERGGFSRHEVEVPISDEAFDHCWQHLVGERVIRKTRTGHHVRDLARGPYWVNVDVFAGRLRGLVLAEIEFESWRASVEFDPPTFFGEEVTYDRRYRNAYLAEFGQPPLQDVSDDEL